MSTLNSSNIKTLEFDVLVIGGGGSGMRTSLELAKSGLKTAVVSKVFQLDLIQYLLREGLLAR